MKYNGSEVGIGELKQQQALEAALRPIFERNETLKTILLNFRANMDEGMEMLCYPQDYIENMQTHVETAKADLAASELAWAREQAELGDSIGPARREHQERHISAKRVQTNRAIAQYEVKKPLIRKLHEHFKELFITNKLAEWEEKAE